MRHRSIDPRSGTRTPCMNVRPQPSSPAVGLPPAPAARGRQRLRREADIWSSRCRKRMVADPSSSRESRGRRRRIPQGGKASLRRTSRKTTMGSWRWRRREQLRRVEWIRSSASRKQAPPLSAHAAMPRPRVRSMAPAHGRDARKRSTNVKLMPSVLPRIGLANGRSALLRVRGRRARRSSRRPTLISLPAAPLIRLQRGGRRCHSPHRLLHHSPHHLPHHSPHLVEMDHLRQRAAWTRVVALATVRDRCRRQHRQ